MHPRFLVDAEMFALVDLWGLWRGGMSGHGPLPFSGGSAEQPAIVMDAFDFCEGVAALLSPESGS